MRASTVRAQQLLAYSFTDPAGAVDVTSMFLFFDLKGNYKIYLTADSSHPFVGKFRVNINLFNPDADPNDSAFSDACTKKCGAFDGNTDYDIRTPTTKLKITGRDPVLTHWAAGDRVVTSSFAGLTPGLLFLNGLSILENDVAPFGEEVQTCKYAYHRVDTNDPGIGSCP